jgi:hypothetical protein
MYVEEWCIAGSAYSPIQAVCGYSIYISYRQVNKNEQKICILLNEEWNDNIK